MVGSNAWVIHRQEEAFGDEVNEFRPERWLDPVRKAEMRKLHASSNTSCKSLIETQRDISSLSGADLEPAWAEVSSHDLHQQHIRANVDCLV